MVPQPLPTGTETYYRDRVADFVRRHPHAQHPSYYLDFGDKCLHQFLATKPELSGDGQRWLDTTLRLLRNHRWRPDRARPVAQVLRAEHGPAT